MQERDAAATKFLDMPAEDVAQKAAAAPVMIIPEASAAGGVAAPAEMTAEQTMAVQVAIANAATLQEVHRLESALKAGRMPELAAEDGREAMQEG